MLRLRAGKLHSDSATMIEEFEWYIDSNWGLNQSEGRKRQKEKFCAELLPHVLE
jgi:hypothetical protein